MTFCANFRFIKSYIHIIIQFIWHGETCICVKIVVILHRQPNYKHQGGKGYICAVIRQMHNHWASHAQFYAVTSWASSIFQENITSLFGDSPITTYKGGWLLTSRTFGEEPIWREMGWTPCDYYCRGKNPSPSRNLTKLSEQYLCIQIVKWFKSVFLNQWVAWVQVTPIWKFW